MFRLRLGLSQLKSHKKKYNFLGTSSDIRDYGIEPEYSIHFFIKCPLFLEPRLRLVEVTSIILYENDLTILLPSELLKLYLYGYAKLSFAENKRIILASIKYITETNQLLVFLYYLLLFSSSLDFTSYFIFI